MNISNLHRKAIAFGFATLGFFFHPSLAFATAPEGAVVMNPGETHGQLIFISAQDLSEESAKYKSLNPLSIPVFSEMPLELTVIAGSMTLLQQNLLSHVQLKSRARGTPNLDISQVAGGVKHAFLEGFKEGDWIYMKLSREGDIVIELSSQSNAESFYEAKTSLPDLAEPNMTVKQIMNSGALSSADFIAVGSKAANYAELANALNTPERTVVRPNFAVPFSYYQEFVEQNPNVKQGIQDVLDDPIMDSLMDVEYRDEVLSALREEILKESNIINPELIDSLLAIFEEQKDSKGLPRKMKLRSSTNAEDLPNFNGAGLYTSKSYKPIKKGKERSESKKKEEIREALQVVWASIWNLRAWDERNYFRIPHAKVKMGVQINPSFANEDVDGVVITKNIVADATLAGSGVYIEAQRGDEHSVANPVAGVIPQRILVHYNEAAPLNKDEYVVHVLQNSNIADDKESILPAGEINPKAVMETEEIKDLVQQSLKAKVHFKPILGADDEKFELDIEFKVDSEDTGSRQVYLKQARPYID